MKLLFVEQNKKLLAILTAVLLLTLLCTESAAAGETARVLIVKSGDFTPYNNAVDGFKGGSPRRWDFTEYDLGDNLEKIDHMMRKIDREKPDLVVAVGANALTAMTRAKVSRPVVFCMVMNPQVYDIAGTNITGVSLNISAQEQIEVLTSLSPKIHVIGALCRKQNSSEFLKSARDTAEKYRVKIVPVELESEKQMPGKLRPVLDKVDALWMLDDSFIHSRETLQFVILKAVENNLPFMAISEAFVKEGALVSLSPSYFDNGKQAADLAQDILAKKTKAGDIPVSLHENPHITINLKIAKKMDITVPPVLLARAKKVYE